MKIQWMVALGLGWTSLSAFAGTAMASRPERPLANVTWPKSWNKTLELACQAYPHHKAFGIYVFEKDGLFQEVRAAGLFALDPKDPPSKRFWLKTRKEIWESPVLKPECSKHEYEDTGLTWSGTMRVHFPESYCKFGYVEIAGESFGDAEARCMAGDYDEWVLGSPVRLDTYCDGIQTSLFKVAGCP